MGECIYGVTREHIYFNNLVFIYLCCFIYVLNIQQQLILGEKFLGISKGIVYPYSLPTMGKPLLLLLIYTILYIIMIVIAIIV